MSIGTQIDVVMPQMGVSVSEGTVTKWLKQEGDAVARDEPLLEISTDKVDTEVPSPGEGVVAKIHVQEGQTVDVGTVLAAIAPAGAEAAAPAETPPEPATQQAADEAAAVSSAEGDAAVPPQAADAAVPPQAADAAVPPQAADVGVPPEAPDTAAPAAVPPSPAAAEQPDATAEGAPSGNGKTFVSPVVARIAAEHGVDPNSVQGTGTGGRVTKKDILAFIDSGQAQAAPAPTAPAPEVAVPAAAAAAPPTAPPPAAPPPPAPPATPPVPAAAAPGQAPPQAEPGLAPGESAEPMTAMRKGVMEHMRRSLDTSAHVTSAIEVDMSQVVAARANLKKEYETNYGVNPTYLAFIAKATVETLKDWPWVNGEIRDDRIITRQFVHLGIAVALEGGKGLIVPVIRHAEGLNLLGLARTITDLAERARTKKLLPDDVQGGTFTITNPGGFGTFHGTPIINQPQVGILGTYAVVKRPWVVQDDLGQDVIAIRPIMNLTLTYDHRVVDGAYAGAFLRDLRERLERWDATSD